MERDSLSRELLRTIRQKVALTQELEAWQVRGGAHGADGEGPAGAGPGRTLTRPARPQDDMQVVIGQQLRSQRQQELSAAASTPRPAPTRFSLRLSPGPAGSFFSTLFRRT